jgi:hypothetical protein
MEPMEPIEPKSPEEKANDSLNEIKTLLWIIIIAAILKSF